jgi:hypothetical protein
MFEVKFVYEEMMISLDKWAQCIFTYYDSDDDIDADQICGSHPHVRPSAFNWIIVCAICLVGQPLFFTVTYAPAYDYLKLVWRSSFKWFTKTCRNIVTFCSTKRTVNIASALKKKGIFGVTKVKSFRSYCDPKIKIQHSPCEIDNNHVNDDEIIRQMLGLDSDSFSWKQKLYQHLNHNAKVLPLEVELPPSEQAFQYNSNATPNRSFDPFIRRSNCKRYGISNRSDVEDFKCEDLESDSVRDIPADFESVINDHVRSFDVL